MMAISGNATTAEGLPADFVRIFSWPTSELVGVAVPDESGGWSHEVPLTGEYGLTYIAAGCQPITHGPYYIEVDIVGDLHWDKVVALLHFDGDFTDERGSIWTAHGGANTHAAYIKFGTGSGAFPKNTISPLTTPDSPSFRLGTDDFTIEGWFLPEQPQYGFGAVFIKGLNTSNGVSLGVTPTSAMFRYSGTTGVTVNFPEITEFTHIAVVRESGVVGIYVGGQELIKQPITFDHTSTDLVQLGSNSLVGGTSGYSYGGYIDDFRITKGVARYTEDFTPPTEPFPNFGPA